MSRRPPATLVVFTLGPRIDARRHPLLLPAAIGLEHGLRHACLEGAFEAGRATGMGLVACSPEPLREVPVDAQWLRQAGGTFGERFEAAVEGSFREAPGPKVIVGGDVPGLDESLLEAALEGLARDPATVVVGPARDGGFYLLAMAQPLGPVLRQVRWCRPETRDTLLAALRRAGRPVLLLPPLRDLDRPADVERWLAERRAQPARIHLWSDRLLRFLNARRRPWLRPLPHPSSLGVVDSILGRAPPLPASS